VFCIFGFAICNLWRQLGTCPLLSTVGSIKNFTPRLLVNFTGYCSQTGACILFSSFASKDRVIRARQWLF